jgi:hypothetical protein
MSTTPDTVTKARWKPMDVAYHGVIAAPRILIIEVHTRGDRVSYEYVSERDGVGADDERSIMATADEWLEWLTRFQDEMLGRDYREAQERVRNPLVEPKSWAGFRERYAATGCPWIQ